MPNITKFFISIVINFVVLACVSILFEYFDTGDDPLYSMKVAVKNLVMSLIITGTIFFMYRKTAGADRA
ncbi:MAG: hypothetical protein AAF333_11320 [Planctomycetota bacterium]